jgi:maleate cis-trans isomerase
MADFAMPKTWTAAQKLFPHQVGFTCPPFDFDAAPSDFLRMCPSSVGVHGWMLHVPDYVHDLNQRKQNFGMLEDFVYCMARNGVDVCGQVGSNWVHASGLGVEGIRQHCQNLSEKYNIQFHMAGYAMVEALRELNVEKVALNAAYHWPDWWQGTVGFLKEAGFDVVWAGNFVDQGWFTSQEEVNAKRWIFDGDLARKSFSYVADKAPTADAILINGMCNFRTGPAGMPQRPVHLEAELETLVGKPVIGHDTALYWRIMKDLAIAPTTRQGKLLESLKCIR